MKIESILMFISLARHLVEFIPQWIDEARAKGELTPEAEAAFLEHKKWVYAQPWAQPGSPTPTPTPPAEAPSPETSSA